MTWYQANMSGGQGLAILHPDGSAEFLDVPYDAADAPLVAAAPAMLAALQFYAGWGIDGPAHDEAVSIDSGDRAREAIRLATQCNHDWQRDGTSIGGCIGIICTRCGVEDEKDIS